MPLDFDCTHCRRRIRAPEELAGKKAKCPQCQQVVDVPEPVYQAEEIAPPPAPPGAPFDAEAGETAGERRPCPMCGEQILVSALKCRFCGSVFDAALAASAPMSEGVRRAVLDDLGKLSRTWMWVGVLVGLGSLFVMLDPALRNEERAVQVVVIVITLGIAACWIVCAMGASRRQTWAVYAGLALSYVLLLLIVLNGCRGFLLALLVIYGLQIGHRVVGKMSRID